MADTQTGKLPELGEREGQPDAGNRPSNSETLRCQWCSVDLPQGETVCPTCGSPGVDASMLVPGAEQTTTPPGSPATVPESEEELVEWWNDAEDTKLYKDTDEQNQMPIILGLVGTAVICIILGVVVAPMVLASLFENSLGITVEDANDLRPLGGILGLLVGAFIGAMGMWVTAPRR